MHHTRDSDRRVKESLKIPRDLPIGKVASPLKASSPGLLLISLKKYLDKEIASPSGKEGIPETGLLAAVLAAYGSALVEMGNCCLLYTSPSPRDRQKSRMPSSA